MRTNNAIEGCHSIFIKHCHGYMKNFYMLVKNLKKEEANIRIKIIRLENNHVFLEKKYI